MTPYFLQVVLMVISCGLILMMMMLMRYFGGDSSGLQDYNEREKT